MAFEDLKEQSLTYLKGQWEQFQESSLYIQINDRYENLSPLMQKLSVLGVIAVIALAALSFPLGYYSNSNDSLQSFHDKRTLIRDLLKASREAQEVPDIPVPPGLDAIKSRIETELRSARLVPDQMKGINQIDDSSSLADKGLTQGTLEVTLAKLNLRQIIDLGYQLQAISPSVKVKDLAMSPNQENPAYFDAVYKLMVLAVPEQAEGGE